MSPEKVIEAKKGFLSKITSPLNKIADAIPGVKQIKNGVGALLGGIHGKLEKRYGSKVATGVMTSGSLGGYAVAIGTGILTGGLLPLGIPIVNDLVSIGIHAAVAEASLRLGLIKKAEFAKEDEHDVDIEAIIKEVVKELRKGAAEIAEEHYNSIAKEMKANPEMEKMVRQLVADIKSEK